MVLETIRTMHWPIWLTLCRSLGCTVIELLTGKPPYADLIAMTTLWKVVVDEHPPIPENISLVLHFCNILARILALTDTYK